MPEQPYRVRLDRDVAIASGPEAESYLQGQLSQDVSDIRDGGHGWSWILAPNGKVDALVRVGRLAADRFVLDTDAGYGQAVVDRLARFKLRTKIDVAAVPGGAVVGLRGALAVPAGADLVYDPPWPGVVGVDIVLLDGDVGRAGLGSPASGAVDIGADEYEVERIAVGMPRMGAELTERTIPGETGLVPLTVSFTKGCYTGQELVARIDSRGGNVPRHLRLLRSRSELSPGAELRDGDTAVGTVTSAARRGDGWIGLGYVRRAFEVPGRLVSVPGGEPVDVEALSVPPPGG